MKLSNLFYVFALLISMNVFVQGFKNVQGKNVNVDNIGMSKVDEMQKRKQQQKIIMISTVVTGIALLLGSALGLGYLSKSNKKAEVPDEEKDENKKVDAGKNSKESKANKSEEKQHKSEERDSKVSSSRSTVAPSTV
ncbi:early transcribed membrane protein 4 [Plasmodium gaboni]|uniref:Early transcribed membrane protein 4 n=1 Tax=Plasmodium gaboni TaxID=647221 RepID=A0A151LUQ0_9APIC|nr:early transcribed membrane protein 4 [Plasmodium gaboni]KYO02921.1 early transcribed membrane protein 4 [Plasmodium gaboni]SOV11444.1 early transcribed membrane protein 4 [Plasmodium gaboni]